jgi:hypothetical protein
MQGGWQAPSGSSMLLQTETPPADDTSACIHVERIRWGMQVAKCSHSYAWDEDSHSGHLRTPKLLEEEESHHTLAFSLSQ